MMLQIIREYLLDLAQQKLIPRRLANAAQSLFKNAAGTRSGNAGYLDVYNWPLQAMVLCFLHHVCRLTELLSQMSSLALQQHHGRLFPADAALSQSEIS